MINKRSHPILIVGAGSIGERYIRNLWKLDFDNIHVYRQRNLPFRDIGDAKVCIHLDWDEIIKLKPYAAFITSPTSLHIKHALACANLGSHVLIEKPLSNSLEKIDELEDVIITKSIYFRTAYMMRFHPLIIRIKEIILNKELGDLLSFASKWGEYLPNWHPWEDYRVSYASKKELGGGAALTLSHDIDLSNWLCNSNIKQHITFKNFISKLEVNVEAGADILIHYENGIIGNIQLNYFEKVPERYIRLIFDNGSILFDYFQNSLTIKTLGNTANTKIENYDRNDMFIDQINAFFGKIENYAIDESIEQLRESISLIKICNE